MDTPGARRPAPGFRYMTLSHRWGKAAMAAAGGSICALALLGGRSGLTRLLAARGLPCQALARADGNDPVLAPIRDWLEAFLIRGQCHALPVSVDPPPGTPFQKSVWREISKIPRGETRTYREIARKIGNPLAARAVGAASASNPIPPLIPCHRLTAAGGGLRGYTGSLEMKRWLLDIERP